MQFAVLAVFATTAILASSCRKRTDNSPVLYFTYTAANGELLTRTEKCQKKGGKFIHDHCMSKYYNVQKYCAHSKTQRWDPKSNSCVVDTEAQRAYAAKKCGEKGDNFSFRQGKCFPPGSFDPKCPKDFSTRWNGEVCVAKDEAPNFYRICINPANDAQRKTIAAIKAQIELEDCQALYQQLGRRTELYLNAKGISDLSPLRGLTAIHSFYLNQNKISSIEVFRNFSYLKVLDLSDNPIRDLSPLTQVENLDTLIIKGAEAKSTLDLKGKVRKIIR